MALRWWEKTVEYKFVMLVAQSNSLFLAPLDGPQEIAGDAIFSSENRWVLIEFKKDVASIKTEKEKFSNYANAYAALCSRDGHHHLIFGHKGDGDSPRLELSSQTYFSGTACDLNQILGSGTNFRVFKDYVTQYIKFKKGPKGGGGPMATMEDLALVAGVNADNNVVECLSLTEFQRQLGLELKQERYLSRGFDGPSR